MSIPLALALRRLVRVVTRLASLGLGHRRIVSLGNALRIEGRVLVGPLPDESPQSSRLGRVRGCRFVPHNGRLLSTRCNCILSYTMDLLCRH